MTHVNWKGPTSSTVVLIIGILAGVLLAEKSLDWWFLAIALIFAALVWAFRKSFGQVSRHLLSFLVQLFATLVGGLDTEHLTLERGLVVVIGIGLYFGAQVVDRVVAPPAEDR